MDYIPKHAQPFTFAQARELDIPTITKEIERLGNSLYHLNRTQIELNSHLAGSSDEDSELLEVIRENEGVIASQNERISMLKLALEEQGVNTKSVHYDPANDGVREVTAPIRQSQGSSTNNNGIDPESGEQEETGEGGGIYL